MGGRSDIYSKANNGESFPQKTDVTVQIKLGKPFGLFNLQAGVISAIFKIQPKLHKIEVIDGASDTYTTADHLSIGGWRGTFFGSTTKTFVVRNATPTTKIRFNGHIQTAIYDVRVYMETPPTTTDTHIIDDIDDLPQNTSGWVMGYVSKVDKVQGEYKDEAGNAKNYEALLLTVRNSFENPTKTIEIPLFAKNYNVPGKAVEVTENYQQEDLHRVFNYSPEPYYGQKKLEKIYQDGDLINSKIVLHAIFNRTEKVKVKYKTGTNIFGAAKYEEKDDFIIDPVSNPDKVLIMTPLYSELTDYDLRDVDVAEMEDGGLMVFDNVGTIDGKVYNGKSINHHFYVSSLSHEDIRNRANVITMTYDKVDMEDNFLVGPLPSDGKIQTLKILDEGDNKDFWNLYETKIIGGVPTYDRNINSNSSVKSFIAPFDVKNETEAFTAYTFDVNSSLTSGNNGNVRVKMVKVTDAVLNANTPYMLMPNAVLQTPYDVRANDNVLHASVMPSVRGINWNFTGTFRKLYNADAVDLGAVVLSGGKLYKIDSGTDSYVPALRSFLQSPIDFWMPNNAKMVFVFDDDIFSETTDIPAVPAMQKQNSNIYSLDGRCVGTNLNVLEKGIYIVNGKKVIKK